MRPQASAPEPPAGARRRRGAAQHCRDLHAQVVLAALLAAAPDERAAGDLGLGYAAVHAVAAVDEHGAGTQVHAQEVDADDELAAEAARDEVAPRMGSRLLGAQDAVGDLLGDPRVVLRELRERAVAEQEEPAVADVRGDE